MQRAESLEKTLVLGRIESRRRRERQRMRWSDDIIDWIDMNLGKLCSMVRDREAWSVAVHRVTKHQKWLGDLTATPAFSSHKKEQIWVRSSEVDEPRAYYTEQSKSEREKQVLYINAYIWNLESWYWWTCLQGSNADADTEKRLVDTVREGEGGTNWENDTETHTLPSVKQIASGNLLYDAGSPNPVLWQPTGVGWGGKWEKVSRRRGRMYSYGWFMYGRNQHNSIKQLSSN